MMPLRIAIVTDDRARADAWLDVVSREPEWTVSAPSDSPNIVLVDAAFGDRKRLCANWSDAGCPVLVANVNDDGSALEALDAGARGVVYAAAPTGDLVRALRAVHAGEVWAPRHVILGAWSRMRTELAKRNAGEAALAQRLSSREREVFRYAAAGMGNRELAHRLAISEATVKVHLTHIFQKLGVRGRSELAAAFHGILR